MNDEIQELLNTTKKIYVKVIEDDELRSLQAKSASLSYNSFIAEGFTGQQSLELVAASIKAAK